MYIYIYTHTHTQWNLGCPYLPTPLLRQDMTQRQFLSGV